MSSLLEHNIERLEARIEVMTEKYEADPCWMNETLLECMLRDYEAKQRLLIKEQST
jgi:hypothetical protein|tara:strand:- start:321 stop:488 length:168 start_codon:yes stop_codon:yes gene_type:complete